MRLVIKTTVDKDLFTIAGAFDEQFFRYLLPWRAITKVIRYEGHEPGNIVEFGFRLPFIKNWIVVIKDSWKSSREILFVDRGLSVPFGIYFWQHIHKVISLGKNRCVIIDEIEFESNCLIQDYFNYLMLYVIFSMRRLHYRKYLMKIRK